MKLYEILDLSLQGIGLVIASISLCFELRSFFQQKKK